MKLELLHNDFAGQVYYGFAPTPFAEAILAFSGLGLHFFLFVPDVAIRNRELHRVIAAFGHRGIKKDNTVAKKISSELFSASDETGQSPSLDTMTIPPIIQGTEFQTRVWAALLQVPEGHTTTYTRIAREAGFPGSARATANAVGANPIHYFVPCHRVLRSDGKIGGYRAGIPLKRKILGAEARIE